MPSTLRCKAGSIGSLTIQLPINDLWKGALSIVISGVVIEAEIGANHDTDLASRPKLSASLATLAESMVLQDDEEAQKLEQTIHECLDEQQQQQHPGAFTDVPSASGGLPAPGAVPAGGGFLAGITESLLSRLQVELHSLSVVLRFEDELLQEQVLRNGRRQQPEEAAEDGKRRQEEICCGLRIDVNGVKLLQTSAEGRPTSNDVAKPEAKLNEDTTMDTSAGDTQETPLANGQAQTVSSSTTIRQVSVQDVQVSLLVSDAAAYKSAPQSATDPDMRTSRSSSTSTLGQATLPHGGEPGHMQANTINTSVEEVEMEEDDGEDEASDEYMEMSQAVLDVRESVYLDAEQSVTLQQSQSIPASLEEEAKVSAEADPEDQLPELSSEDRSAIAGDCVTGTGSLRAIVLLRLFAEKTDLLSTQQGCDIRLIRRTYRSNDPALSEVQQTTINAIRLEIDLQSLEVDVNQRNLRGLLDLVEIVLKEGLVDQKQVSNSAAAPPSNVSASSPAFELEASAARIAISLKLGADDAQDRLQLRASDLHSRLAEEYNFQVRAVHLVDSRSSSPILQMTGHDAGSEDAIHLAGSIADPSAPNHLVLAPINIDADLLILPRLLPYYHFISRFAALSSATQGKPTSAGRSPVQSTTSTNPSPLTVRCSSVTVQLSAPTVKSLTSAPDFRSGVYRLQISGISLDQGQSTPRTRPQPPNPKRARFSKSSNSGAEDALTQLMLTSVTLQHTAIGQTEARDIACITAGDAAPGSAVTLRALKNSDVQVKIASISLSLSKRNFDAIQMLADDLTSWTRFLEHKYVAMCPRQIEVSEDATTAGSFSLDASSLSVQLHLSEAREQRESERPSVLSATANGFTLQSKPSQGVMISLVAATAEHQCSSNTPRTKTLLRLCHPQGRSSVRLDLTTDPSITEDNPNVSVVLTGASCFFDVGDALLDDIARFAQAPAGVFEDVQPSARTLLSISLRDFTIGVGTAHAAMRGLVLFSRIDALIELTAATGLSKAGAAVNDLAFLLHEDPEAHMSLLVDPHSTHSKSAWMNLGFAWLLDIPSGSLSFKNAPPPSGSVILLDGFRVDLMACADTLSRLANFVSEIHAGLRDSDPSRPELAEDRSDAQPGDVPFHRIEDMAGAADPVNTPSDLMDDDLPSRSEYLGALQDDIRTDVEGSTVLAGQGVSKDDLLLSTNTVSVRHLGGHRIRPRLGYFSSVGSDRSGIEKPSL